MRIFIFFFTIISTNLGFGQKYLDCEVIQDGIHKESGQYIKELGFEDLFIFTPYNLKNSLNRPLVEGKAQLYQSSGFINMEARIKVNSKLASKDYGKIEQGTMIKFFLMNGGSFYTFNGRYKRAKIKQAENSTVYTLSCSFDKDELKMLKESYIDKIGVVWSEGYEEYEIFNPDFFVNQLACLESK